MSSYVTEIYWQRGEQSFIDNRYSRKHTWRFDGGIEVPASASPHVVPLPYSAEEAVDPEEAFVVSLSSCHMLWFLNLAAKLGFAVDEYSDVAVGVMDRDAAGKLAIIEVVLRPKVRFSGAPGARQPNRTEIDALHHQAHEECFIANSVRTNVRCEPKHEEG